MNVKKSVVNELKSVPKTEIHLHIEAVTTSETVWALMQKHNIKIEGVKTKKDIEAKYNISSLQEFIDLFINIVQGSFKIEEDFNLLIDDLDKYLKDNNIVYTEVFFAPTSFLRNGLNFDKILTVLTEGADRIYKKDGNDVKFIIDVSRGFGLENAMNNLNHALGFNHPRIIGIGLGGAEKVGKAEEFEPVFKKAIENNLHVVAHAGEDADYTSVDNAVNILKAERIGHGISSIHNEASMENLKNKNIPLEVCPTSNLFTKAYVSEIKEHPVRTFFDKGLFVTINSDDPTIFGSTLLEEYGLLVENGIFSKKEIGQLILNNLRASFMPDSNKDSLEIKMHETLNNIGYL